MTPPVRDADNAPKAFLKFGTGALVCAADQTISSGTTFITGILLARWFEPDEYGAFVIGYAVFLVLSRIHQALILEPMCVFAARHRRWSPAEYAAIVLRMHWLTAAAMGGALAACGAACGLGVARHGWALAAAGLALPFLLLQWTLRRLAYLRRRPEWALAGTVAQAAALLTGLAAARRADSFPVAAVWLLMAGAALLSSLLMAGRLGCGRLAGGADGLRDAAALHWGYGKWAAGFALADALADSLYLPLIGLLLGLGQAAAFRATEILLQPVQILLSAVVLFGLPGISEKVDSGGREFLHRAGRLLPAGLAVVCGGYLAVAVTAAPRLAESLYQRPFYSQASSLAPLLAAAVLIRALGDGGWGLLLRAAARPRALFWGALAGAAVSLLAGVPCLLIWKSSGAAAARIAVAACFTAMVASGFARLVSTLPGKGTGNAICACPA